MPLMTARTSLPMLENANESSDAHNIVQLGRTIKGDPLKVQYTNVFD